MYMYFMYVPGLNFMPTEVLAAFKWSVLLSTVLGTEEKY